MKTRLAPCPRSPNCVSSLASSPGRRIEPFGYNGPPEAAVKILAGLLRDLPRCRIETEEAGYIHAVVASPVFRFKDDLEFLADDDRKVIHVRSAARTGWYDFGVNRRRVEKLRARWGRGPEQI